MAYRIPLGSDLLHQLHLLSGISLECSIRQSVSILFTEIIAIILLFISAMMLPAETNMVI